jgi:excisionase family DNA binding protein
MVGRRSGSRQTTERVWLTTGEAGALLGVSGKTVLRLVKDRKLGARVTEGGQFRLERAAVERFAAAQVYDPDNSKEDRALAPS